MQLYQLINRLANKQRRQFNKMSYSTEISGATAKLLHYILNQKDHVIFQKEIEEEFGLRPPTATGLLQNMEENGLITREVLPADARYKHIVATEKAESYHDDLDRDMELLVKKLANGINEKELTTWIRITEQMIQNLS